MRFFHTIATWTILLFFIVLNQALLAQEIPPRPSPPRLVNDLAGILDQGQAAELEKMLVAFNDSTTTQIAIVTVSNLGGYDKATFAYEIGQQWGVGKKGQDNGVVILVKPKTVSEQGDIFIAPGYGLESVIPDATCKQIIENEMIPRFRNNDYYGGIRAATMVVMSLATGEFKATQYKKKGQQHTRWGILVPIIIFILFFVIFRGGRGKQNHIGGNVPFLTWLFLLSSMNSSGSGGGSGGWGGSGGGGGGFGGFGGGSFGGGGAGGSW